MTQKILSQLLEYARSQNGGNRGSGYIQGVEDCIAVMKYGSIKKVEARDNEIKRQRAEGKKTQTKGLK